MITKNILATILVLTIQIPHTANALIGPIIISLNTKYRTSAPIIGPVATTIKLSKSDIKRTGFNKRVRLGHN